MNFSILATIRRLLAPRHELSCSWFLWRKLLKGLRDRGLESSRESGAFLLGHRSETSAHIVDFILYDDLDPHALDSGIVRFDGRYYGLLWDICKRRNLTVVADVHVHPGGASQSRSDQEYPMISRAGHIAMILPNFARGPVRVRDVGIYRYLGSKEWQAIPFQHKSEFIHIGL